MSSTTSPPEDVTGRLSAESGKERLRGWFSNNAIKGVVLLFEGALVALSIVLSQLSDPSAKAGVLEVSAGLIFGFAIVTSTIALFLFILWKAYEIYNSRQRRRTEAIGID